MINFIPKLLVKRQQINLIIKVSISISYKVSLAWLPQIEINIINI